MESVSPLGRGWTNASWTIGFAVVQFVIFVVPVGVLAQEEALIQGIEIIPEIQILGRPRMGQAANLQIANSKPQLLKQMRGLIQNELTIINGLCNLKQEQKQTLVDLAEEDWKAKTNTWIIKRTQEHVYGSIDLDSLAERVVRTWLESVATPVQLSKYDEELADRMNWRKKALISKMLDILAEKLTLSGVQMTQIEEVLSEKWKDRWFRSLEASFENTSLLPEIKPSWIAPLLTQSQSAALITRDQQMLFGAPQGSVDSPSLALEQRFQAGSAISAEEREGTPDAKKP